MEIAYYYCFVLLGIAKVNLSNPPPTLRSIYDSTTVCTSVMRVYLIVSAHPDRDLRFIQKSLPARHTVRIIHRSSGARGRKSIEWRDEVTFTCMKRWRTVRSAVRVVTSLLHPLSRYFHDILVTCFPWMYPPPLLWQMRVTADDTGTCVQRAGATKRQQHHQQQHSLQSKYAMLTIYLRFDFDVVDVVVNCWCSPH